MKKYYKQSLADKVGKYLFWFIWLGLVVFGSHTILRTPISSTLNLLERISGVFVFSLLFIQIALRKNINPIIYLLIFIHPLFLFAFNYKIFHTLDPFYIYTQACLLCKNNLELFYTFGRLGFWFLTIALFAANWKKLHFVNYVVFFFVALHGWFVGSDFHLFPLSFFFWLSTLIIFLTVLSEVRSKNKIA